MSDSDSDSDFFGPHDGFDDLLTVLPTELNIPIDFNEEHYSCSIQLTNKTDRTVAYQFWPSWGIHLVYEEEDTNVGSILPRSTSSVTVTVKLSEKEPPPKDKVYYIEIYAFVVKDGVKAEDITSENLHDLTDTETSGFYYMPVVYYYSTVVPAANPSSAVPMSDSDSDSDFFGPHDGFDDLLTVIPTELNIPIDFNEEEHYSCSIHLTNKTDRIVTYYFRCSWGMYLVSPDEYTYVGTILPRSTSSVTVTVNFLGKKPDPENREWIDIYAFVVKDGVKAEDITRENLFCLVDVETRWFFRMRVVYYSTVVPAGNPSSAVPDMANSPSSSRLPPASSDENNDFLSEENINSGGKKKRTRGKTKVPVVAIGEKNRTIIEWNEYGQPVGKNSDGFSTTVGCLVRDNVPINIDNWHNVDKRIKESLWDLMMQKYVIEDCRKKFILRLMGKLWRNWKSSLSRSIRKVEDVGVDVPRHIDSLKPNESTKLEWDEFVKSRTSDKFKELRQTKQTARAKQTMPYTLSRKGYARYAHEWKIENAGKSISRADLLIEGRKKRKGEKRGQPINDAAEKAISEMENYKELLNSGNSTSINEDPVSKYFGPERSGSVRGLGFGVTPSRIEVQLQNKSRMQSVRTDMFPGEPSNGRALPSPSSRQLSQASTRAQESVDRQIADLRDELLRRITEQPNFEPQTDDATITARFDTLEQSLIELKTLSQMTEHSLMELRTLSQTTERSLATLAASTERRQTELEGSHTAMSDSLARIHAAQDLLSRSVTENTSRMVFAMDSYNARLLALEQIRPPGLPASTLTPSITLPSLSGPVMLSQEQYGFLLSQMRGNAPPPPDPQ